MKERKSASHPGVLLIGNFFTGRSGTHGVGQDLAVALKTAGWSVHTTSAYPGRVARLLDFLMTNISIVMILNKHAYQRFYTSP